MLGVGECRTSRPPCFPSQRRQPSSRLCFVQGGRPLSFPSALIGLLRMQRVESAPCFGGRKHCLEWRISFRGVVSANQYVRGVAPPNSNRKAKVRQPGCEWTSCRCDSRKVGTRLRRSPVATNGLSLQRNPD